MNFRTAFLPIFSAAIFCLFGCGGETSTTQNPSGNNSGTEPATNPTTHSTPSLANDPRQKILLDGYYSTSEAAGFSAARLFDGDPKTGWRTQTGAGPDEGIMFYFSENQQVDIKSVEISADADASFGADAVLYFYVNGQMNASSSPGKKVIFEKPEGNRPMRALFVRVAETGKETATKKTTAQGKLEMKIFPKTGFVGLENLKFMNSAGQELRLVAPEIVKGKVTANTLEPESAYSPANLFDARKDFVWVEGDKNATAEGEILTFEFEKPVQISALEIWNGYQRSDNHYKTNARLKDFSFGESGGLAKNYTLADRRAGQKIELAAPAKGQNFQLKIGKAFPGSKYTDLALSEMLFFDGGQPFILQTDLTEKYGRDLRSRAASSPLAEILNRRVSNNEELATTIENRSIILRGDGTFVLYVQTEDEGISAQTIADGNWEIQSADAASASVKIFGKWFDSSSETELYQGEKYKEVTKIFSDILTIDNEKIKGGKMVGTIWLK